MNKHFTSLLDSINQHGQNAAILVNMSRSKGKYVLVDGLRRLKVCKLLKKSILVYNVVTHRTFYISTDRIIVHKRICRGE